MQIIKVSEAQTIEYGFYLWRENAADAWQLARIVEDGWLELFSEEDTGGSDHYTPHGELLGPVQPAQIASTLTNPAAVAQSIDLEAIVNSHAAKAEQNRQNPPAERERFEAWCQEYCCAVGGINFKRSVYEGDDTIYDDPNLETAWQAWQAAIVDRRACDE